MVRTSGSNTHRPVWCVEVSYEDNDPGTYGPYTELQAERVAKALRKEVELATGKYGVNYHPHSVINALACPMGRYDQFLTPGSDYFLAMRNAVRVSNSAAVED